VALRKGNSNSALADIIPQRHKAVPVAKFLFIEQSSFGYKTTAVYRVVPNLEASAQMHGPEQGPFQSIRSKSGYLLNLVIPFYNLMFLNNYFILGPGVSS